MVRASGNIQNMALSVHIVVGSFLIVLSMAARTFRHIYILELFNGIVIDGGFGSRIQARPLFTPGTVVHIFLIRQRFLGICVLAAIEQTILQGASARAMAHPFYRLVMEDRLL